MQMIEHVAVRSIERAPAANTPADTLYICHTLSINIKASHAMQRHVSITIHVYTPHRAQLRFHAYATGGR